MDKKITAGLILIFFSTASFALWPFGKTDEKKEQHKRIKNEIEEIKENPELYYGEAFAEIKRFEGQLWEATEEARRRARKRLNEYIKVRIDSSLRDVLKIEEGEYKKEIEDITEIYADKVLEEIKYQDFQDYPKKGIVTSIAYVSKERYKLTVLKEFEEKKAKIITHLRAGLKALGAELISEALENFIQAKHWYEEFFHQVPLNMDVDKDGKIEEVGALIDVYLSSILKNIKFRQKEERYTYDLEGRVITSPVLFVYYEEKEKKIPVSNIPLNARFVMGEGEISPVELVTGTYGEEEIPVKYVFPGASEASVQVEIALKIEGMKLPFYRIDLMKRKGAVYSVVFERDGKISHPASLGDSIKSILSRYGFDIKEFSLEKTEPTDAELYEAGQFNAEYYIVAVIKASGASKMGDYNMYQSNVTSKIIIYDLKEKRMLASIAGPQASGFGASPSSAASNALGKIKNELSSLLEQEIKKL